MRLIPALLVSVLTITTLCSVVGRSKPILCVGNNLDSAATVSQLLEQPVLRVRMDGCRISRYDFTLVLKGDTNAWGPITVTDSSFSKVILEKLRTLPKTARGAIYIDEVKVLYKGDTRTLMPLHLQLIP